ncbi:hypothetical protein ACFS5M_08265 [Lacinutrix iliipiscaria]|uniref:Helix-turn-helix domain-containing protein n=1 Tax=Lacinutrix iliipiscaria TaxID=1230532 RepID=A0ABW5WR59_9FLAO
MYKTYKKNKTVIKTKNVPGNFTTIQNRILHDKRLTTDSRILLFSILSDSEDFTFSRTGLSKRIGISEHKLDKAIKNLVEFGYMSKTKAHAQYYFYTISEYGNLNQIKDESEKINVNIVEPKEVPSSSIELNSEPVRTKQFYDDLSRLNDFLQETSEYINYKLVADGLEKVQTRDDLFQLKAEITKDISKNKIQYYKEIEEFVNGGYAPKTLKPKILIEVRRIITDEHKKPSIEEVNKIRNKISHDIYKNKVKRHGFDHETQLVDQYENPLD